MEGLIEFKRISVMRGQTRALDDVSLSIGVGEHVAVLGPNGCGKSTLIKTITRECYPLLEEGSSVRILGKERWNVPIANFAEEYFSTVAPVIVGNHVLVGTGNDIDAPGFLQSFDPETGKLQWKL